LLICASTVVEVIEVVVRQVTRIVRETTRHAARRWAGSATTNASTRPDQPRSHRIDPADVSTYRQLWPMTVEAHQRTVTPGYCVRAWPVAMTRSRGASHLPTKSAAPCGVK
jgi:hypothetical protein